MFPNCPDCVCPANPLDQPRITLFIRKGYRGCSWASILSAPLVRCYCFWWDDFCGPRGLPDQLMFPETCNGLLPSVEQF